jgi:hypothetical protein
MSVSLNVQIGSLRFGDAAQTKAKLAETFTERFQGDEIKVSDNQPLTLEVSYNESAGQTLHEQQGGPFGKPTGRTVQSTKIEVKLALKPQAGGAALWNHEFSYDPFGVSVMGKELNDAAARDSIFRTLLFQLSESPVPYFVPRDAPLNVLPGVTAVGGE